MVKKIWTFAIINLMILPVFGQEQKSNAQEAEIFYVKHEYARAANLYERLAKKKKVKLEVCQRLAECYRMVNDYASSEKWYAIVLAKGDTFPQTRIYYGDMLKCQGKYEAAKGAYNLAAQKGSSQGSLLADRIAGCDAAVQWMKDPTPGAINSVPRLNTRLSDWGATWYPNGIVFMSDSLRKDLLQPGSKTDPNLYGRNKHPFFKLYLADTTNYGNVYLFDLSTTFNRYRYHVGPVVFDAAYNTAWFTVTDADRRIEGAKERYPHGLVIHGNRRLELMVSHRDSSGRWAPATDFAYNKPSAYSVGHAAVSADGQTLYFVSDMPGGLGGTDIWYCEMQSNGSWSSPRNVGAPVNTADDEAFPTLAPDGTLYYSSKGGIGMGGFDIFSATGSKSNWTSPQNLRFPLNSPGDDFYYVINQTGAGYLSSNRQGGKGDDDIYYWTPSHTPTINIQKQFVPGLQIPFTANICPPFRRSCIYLYNKKRGIGWCYSAEDGSFTATLEPDTEYVVRITENNKTSSFEFNTNGMDRSNTIEKDICPGGVSNH